MDSIRRFLFERLDIRGARAKLDNAWQAMQATRDWPPPVRALLGELAAVTTLIAGNLKAPGRVTLQLQGGGPVALLLVDCDAQLRLRGTARHACEATDAVSPAPTFRELLGDGQLLLTLQADSGAPYRSIVPLVGETLAEVFEHYLLQSEQQPARLLLTANDRFAAALFLQKLPAADQCDADGWNRLMHMMATLQASELADPLANLLMRVFPEEDIRLFDPRALRYHCPRDEDKVLTMLKSLGRAEIEAALTEQGELVIEDDICQQRYVFGADILPRLFGVD